MREYMISLGSVMMMIAFAQILINDSSIKKFASLAMGFMLISTVVAPLPSKLEDIKIDLNEFKIDDEDIAAAQASYKAEVIKKHRENMEKKIEEKMKHGSQAHVEVSSEGDIVSVSLRLLGDESLAVAYIVDTLKVPRERIKLSYENN